MLKCSTVGSFEKGHCTSLFFSRFGLPRPLRPSAEALSHSLAVVFSTVDHNITLFHSLISQLLFVHNHTADLAIADRFTAQLVVEENSELLIMCGTWNLLSPHYVPLRFAFGSLCGNQRCVHPDGVLPLPGLLWVSLCTEKLTTHGENVAPIAVLLRIAMYGYLADSAIVRCAFYSSNSSQSLLMLRSIFAFVLADAPKHLVEFNATWRIRSDCGNSVKQVIL